MVCAKKAQIEIGDALGERASVSKPTWVDHTYTCLYHYASGSFTMSVKELSSWSQTLSYFQARRSSLGFTGSLGNLGQGAFSTKNGSVIVRKDWKILDVAIDQLGRRRLDGFLCGELGARIELVGAVVPAKRVDDDFLALPTRTTRVEEVTKQEVQRGAVATVVDGQGAGCSLCLHRLQQRREPAVMKGTLGLHGCGSPVL